jgi:hypothetical protein
VTGITAGANHFPYQPTSPNCAVGPSKDFERSSKLISRTSDHDPRQLRASRGGPFYEFAG